MLSRESLINQFVFSGNQATYDPYDIWNTKPGIQVKKLFYKSKWLGMIPAGILTIFDFYLNNSLRLGYGKRNYPVVHAYRVLLAMEWYRKTPDAQLLVAARKSLDWLSENHSTGYSGYCWGANMPWVSKNGTYNENTPFITNTPYVLEAILEYSRISGDSRYDNIVPTVLEFIEKDLIKQVDTENELALSYSPQQEPRIVINANSYALYCYALFYSLYPEKGPGILNKINRIYNFLKNYQQANGSWFYYADQEPGNFIDCFHSCFILKNLIKTNKIIPCNDSGAVIEKGYRFIKNNFFDPEKKLYRRFSRQSLLSLVKFDLYDNAEMLNLAAMLNDKIVVETLQASVKKEFITDNNIYSQLVFPGKKINRNTLRWAVMPYLYAIMHHEITV